MRDSITYRTALRRMGNDALYVSRLPFVVSCLSFHISRLSSGKSPLEFRLIHHLPFTIHKNSMVYHS